MKAALLALLTAALVGCGPQGDTKEPQVEKAGSPHPPGVEGGATRPQ